MNRILFLPGRGLHLVKAAAHDHLDIAATQAPGRTAAVHCGVAAAKHDDPRADAGDMAKGHRSKPVNADVDLFGGLLATGNHQITPARRTAANKNRVELLRQQSLHRIDALPAVELHAQIEDIAGLFVDHRLGQPKARDLRADEAASLGFTIEHRHFIAERGQVTRHRQRRRPGANAGDALAIRRCDCGHAALDLALLIGRHSLQAADRHRFGLGAVVLLDTAASASRLARPVTCAPQHARKHIRDPVDHVGVCVAPLANQTDVFGYRGMGRAGQLAIDNLVEICRAG